MLVPLTVDAAKELKRGEILYDSSNLGADQQPRRWKVNGEVKRWARNPNRFHVPLKHGLYSYDSISELDFSSDGVHPVLCVEASD